MYGYLDVSAITAVAQRLGIELSAAEADLYRRYALEELDALDAFVQSPGDGPAPPLITPAREPGYRPDVTEDPLSAWMWRCRIEGAGQGVLAGKTVSFKDHVAVAGLPMSIGAFALEGFVPDIDATIVTRVLQAGGTVTGKNTMNGLSGGRGSGGGIGDYGRPINPHDHSRVTGGSSSGSAAAVAAGEVDISFGGDQGGSIRIPAAYCGVVGLKPTFGLVSHFGAGFGLDQSIDYVGPLARTASDVAAALQATAGADGYDPRQGRAVPDHLNALDAINDGISGIRIGLLEQGFDGCDLPVKDQVMAAVQLLAGLGAEVRMLSVPEHHGARVPYAALLGEGALAIFRTSFFGAFARTYYPTSIISAVHQLGSSQADRLSPRNKLMLIVGELSRDRYHGRVYGKAHNVRAAYTAAYDRALEWADVLVMPTVPRVAPENAPVRDPLAAIDDSLSTRMSAPASRHTANTLAFNYTGHPALAIPAGTCAGLPVSMQLVGRFFEDALLLRVGHAYQQAARDGS